MEAKNDERPILEVSAEALKHNLNVICSKIPKDCKILIPIKADAYGCGIETILPFLVKQESIYMLGVANPSEAILLRKGGWKKGILLLGSFFVDDIPLFFEYDITPTITDFSQFMPLNYASQTKKKKFPVHVKLDLGMGRLGFLENNLPDLIDRLSKMSSLKVKGIMTHFPSRVSGPILQQTHNFLSIVRVIMRSLRLEPDTILHAANSYAIIKCPNETAMSMVRPGLAFYGYFQDMISKRILSPDLFPIKPCLRLRVRPFSYRILPKDSWVSYDSLYKVKEDNYPVGVLPIGYADGIPTTLSNRISFEGKPLIGRVTMDQIILGNLTEDTKTVELLGNNSPPIEDWAKLSGRIVYEILTGLGKRLNRRLVKD